MATTSQGMESCIPVRGENDKDKNTNAMIGEAAAVAVAVLNTAAAIKMADQQWDIANDYLKISKAWRSLYNRVYKPCEDKELAEACGAAYYQPNFDNTIGRHLNTARMLFAGKADKAGKCVSEYCTGARAALIKDQLVSEANAMAAMAGLGQRNEQAYKDAQDDRRFKRREQALNRGRGMIANNVAFSNLAAGIFGDLGKQAGAGVAGAIYSLAYDRRPTVYPDTRIHNPVQTAPEEARKAPLPPPPVSIGGDKDNPK